MSEWNIVGKRVFITGAARGIGEAVAKQLHEKGACVALVGLEAERLKSIADGLGKRALYVEADVSNRKAIDHAVEKTVQAFGGIDVVIANAGMYHVSPISEAHASGIERTLNVNLFGVLNTVYATLPYIKQSKGYILTVASMAALTHGPLMGAYAASKAAVEALTDSLRIELYNDGISVGCAYFAAIDTDLVKGGKMHPALSKIEETFPSFIRKPAPLSDAINVIERGIQRRSHRIWAPRWLAAFIILRGAVQPIMEKHLVKHPNIKLALNISNREAQIDGRQDASLGVALLAADNSFTSGKSCDE